MKVCTCCGSHVPNSGFYTIGGRLMSECKVCNRRRKREGGVAPRVSPAPRAEVHINNAASLWHGPVDRKPLRWAA